MWVCVNIARFGCGSATPGPNLYPLRMKIIQGMANLLRQTRSQGGCALTIGNFDGVHRGHQAMLALLGNEARQLSLIHI